MKNGKFSRPKGGGDKVRERRQFSASMTGVETQVGKAAADPMGPLRLRANVRRGLLTGFGFMFQASCFLSEPGKGKPTMYTLQVSSFDGVNGNPGSFTNRELNSPRCPFSRLLKNSLIQSSSQGKCDSNN